MIELFSDVLAAAKAGDRAAVTVLYRAINPGIERYLAGRAPDAAEDLAADTWIKVAESIQRFEGDEDDFRGWVFTIARNVAIDAHRRSRRQDRVAPAPDPFDDPARGGDSTEAEALDALDTDAVVRLVRRLAPDQADVIMLRVIGGLDTARVAKALGKTPGAVRVLQHRGLRNLERLLRDDSHGTDVLP